MEFRKFNSLENSYNGKLINAVQEQITGKWVVTEKVDGANFAFYADGKDVKVASRNRFVDGTFFACQDVINEIAPKVAAMYSLGNFSGTLIVYGELFGPSVPGRVNYGDQRGFVAFDIVNFADDNDEFPICPKDIAIDLCMAMGIPFSPVIGFYNTLDECLALSNTFTSKLSPQGTEEGTNIAEGLVIEPVEAAFLRSGKRVYIKNKSKAFSEVKARKERVVVALPESVQDVLNDVLPYLTASRVQSVVSKLGEPHKGMFDQILKLTVQDTLEEYEKDSGKEVTIEAGDDFQGFMRELNKIAAKEVRPVFLSLIQ
tara:strand:+ start:11638 stop:12582 length:945 start_codon:yes stop_codon:yes gene_type:complete